jgi:hypothetical protein
MSMVQDCLQCIGLCTQLCSSLRLTFICALLLFGRFDIQKLQERESTALVISILGKVRVQGLAQRNEHRKCAHPGW